MPLDLLHALATGCNHQGSVRNADLFSRAGCQISHDDYIEALRDGGADSSASISLSVHLPFCPVRCFTCDSIAQVIQSPSEVDRYLDSLEQEVDRVAEHFGSGRRLAQLHLGGGSPSCLNDRQIARLMAMLERHFQIDEATETSLKINPKYTSTAQLALLHGFGFRQVTLNLGDLDPDVQLAIGRVASFELVQDVVTAAREIGFEVISADLMYGLPAQTRKGLETTVARLLELAPDRLTCAPYTRQAEAMVHQRAISLDSLPSLEDKRKLFDVIVEGLCSSGYTWIGLDCFAKSEDQLCHAHQQRRLNKNWIGYTGKSTDCFIGLGTNGIVDLQSLCVQNHTDLAAWSGALADGLLPMRYGMRLDDEDCRRRAALMQLVCNMEVSDYAALLGSQDSDQTWNRYARDGLLEITPERLTITEQGRFLFQQILNRHLTTQVAFGV
jgi:oxygen-independent coproporphyrinogen-3 oxidase